MHLHRPRVTRRHALELGAGAAALAALPAGARAAAASCRVPVFEMDLQGSAARASAAGTWRTLPPSVAPRRFDLIGLRWKAGRSLHVEVRARRRRGAWSPWTALPIHAGHAPDDGDGVLGSDPAWTGPADVFQVRYRGDVRGLRARLVRAAPAARLSRLAARSSARRQAPTGAPRIISRAEWGGDACPPREPASYGEVQLAFVHHTVSTNDYGPEDSAAIVLGICRYHRDSNKWNDLGYNFLVDKYGQIFEGRAGGIDQAVVGAQAQGYNAVSTGVASIGDFSVVAQGEAGLDALARLIAWKLSLHGVPTTGTVTVTSAGGSSNRYPAGRQVTLERISGHRDGDQTACPGDALYGQLAALRQRAASYAGPASSLSIRAAAARVRHPRPFGVSGQLRFSDGASTAHLPVDVEHQGAGGAWAVLTRATTAADGSWRASVSAPSSGLVRARFPGTSTHPPLEAAPVRLTVVPRITLGISPRRPGAAERVSVTGTVGPGWPAKAVLRFERRIRGRWVKVQEKRINVRGGRYGSVVRPPGTGLYRVTILVPGASISRRLRVSSLTGGASAS